MKRVKNAPVVPDTTHAHTHMSCLHVFDMDGTLLYGSACLEISRAVGALEENMAIEKAWANGEFSDNAYWQRCLPLWADITEEQIDSAFNEAPWLDGVKKVFADIHSRNEYSVVITQSPKFFVDRFEQWHVSFGFGALVTPGNPEGAEQLVSSDDKLAITQDLLDQLNLGETDCVAYGDSSSDLALFQSMSRTVAVNANETIRDLATVAYDGPDLWAAYVAGRELVDTG